ncbi:azurin [Gilvimarinus xylanilyticus]|uniref:Azurin n=1 Tax=Gilvimarinus xylanilyticus TaxID=2944139 RepID=A0A9X2I6J6_9GAMM|nr:azurin [Gilvimarinus xylanilyticus]MCP8900936.1 azurin [Gilvimarinus xylanilyticus]
MKAVKQLFSIGFLALLGSAAQAQECEVTIDSTDQMRFDTNAMTIPSSCDEFTVNLTHSGNMAKNVMGHNWVLTKASDLQGVAMDGMSAGLDNNYIKPGDERVIAHTDVIGGGESTSVTFDPSALEVGGDYSFFCSFAGHYALMKGTVTVE